MKTKLIILMVLISISVFADVTIVHLNFRNHSMVIFKTGENPRVIKIPDSQWATITNAVSTVSTNSP